MRWRTSLTFLILQGLSCVIGVARADEIGSVVLAKTTGNATLIWQATPFLQVLHSRNESEQAIVADIESAALNMIAARRRLLGRASTITMKVVAAKTAPQNNPAYAPNTFSGFQDLLTINVTRGALANSQTWPKDVTPSNQPNGIKMVIMSSDF